MMKVMNSEPAKRWFRLTRVIGAVALVLLASVQAGAFAGGVGPAAVAASAIVQPADGGEPADEQNEGDASAPAIGGAVTGAAPPGRLAQNLAIIPIKTDFFEGVAIEGGMIDPVTASSVRRRIELAEDQGADTIVFEINTPGGMLGAVLEITEAIKATDLYTIAWINTEAISGGAIIALACDEIVAHPEAIMGDAGIVTMGRELGPTERAKEISPLLADLVDSARRNGYDEVLVQGFVSLGVQAWEIRNKDTGERFFVSRSEYEALFGEAPPTGGSPYVGGGGNIDREWSQGAQFRDAPTPEGVDQVEPSRSDFVEGNPEFTEGIRRDTLRALESRDAPATDRPDFSRADPSDFEYVRYVTAGDTFLTMRTQAMTDLGFAVAEIEDRDALIKHTSTDAANVAVFGRTFGETLVKFMTMSVYGMIINAVLIVTFLLCLFIELSMPGTGVFGTIALFALAGLVAPHVIMSAAGWWIVVAVVGGVGLIAVEAFITPGFGVPGIAGLTLLGVGLIGTFAGAGQTFPGTGAGNDRLAWSLAILLFSVFSAGVGMYLFSRYTKAVPIVNRLVLSGGPSRSTDMLGAMDAEPAEDAEALVRVGDTGTTVSTLRPSGSAEFDGELVDVVAERGMIDKGATVRVVSATRYRVSVVEAAPPGGDTKEETSA